MLELACRNCLAMVLRQTEIFSPSARSLRLKARDRVSLGFIGIEDSIQAGNDEDVLDLLGQVADLQLSATVCNRQVAGGEVGDPRRVDRGHVLKVDDDGSCAVVERVP